MRLPDYAKEWMCSLEAAENTGKITKKFGLAGNANPIVAKLTGDAMLKDITLDSLPSFLQKNLGVDSETARQIALEIALKQLLIIRDHLKNAESFILKLGGALPKTLPGVAQPETEQWTTPAASPHPAISRKPFRATIQENKEILNQLMTLNPIKIQDLEQPVRPTIKNWLSDYIKQKGAGHHEELERSDFLFRSRNAQNLQQEERARLAKILKAYDDDTEVPISPETKLILIDELNKKEDLSQKVFPPSPSQVFKENLEGQASIGPDMYREQVAEEDLAGPLKPLAKPIPRIDGNVVDLKEFGNNEE